MNVPDDAMRAAVLLYDLRKRGWRVSAHNDYENDDGEPRVFWLLTHEDGHYHKSCSKSDAHALTLITAAVNMTHPEKP